MSCRFAWKERKGQGARYPGLNRPGELVLIGNHACKPVGNPSDRVEGCRRVAVGKARPKQNIVLKVFHDGVWHPPVHGCRKKTRRKEWVTREEHTSIKPNAKHDRADSEGRQQPRQCEGPPSLMTNHYNAAIAQILSTNPRLVNLRQRQAVPYYQDFAKVLALLVGAKQEAGKNQEQDESSHKQRSDSASRWRGFR